MIYDDEGCEMKKGYEEIKEALEEYIADYTETEAYIKLLVMNWKNDHSDSIPWKKIIREEFGLII